MSESRYLTREEASIACGVGEGWPVASTTLTNERVSIGGTVPGRNTGPIGEVLKI